MLVEDNPADVRLVREALEEYCVRCELTVISDGERAIDYVHELDAGDAPCPELVILDINLPRRPGGDVLTSMRGSVRCGQVPIVVLTSSDREQDREQAARLGASRYIKKPSRLADFIQLGEIFKEILGGKPN